MRCLYHRPGSTMSAGCDLCRPWRCRVAGSERSAEELRSQLAAQAARHDEKAAELTRARDAVVERIAELEVRLSAQAISDAAVGSDLQGLGPS